MITVTDTQIIKAFGKNQNTVLAVKQILVKGVVSSEDFNQIEKDCPGAWKLLRYATGKTNEELNHLMKLGKLKSNVIEQIILKHFD
jgi:tape measure domain-containing protein